MAGEHKEDGYLEEALAKQRNLMEFYKEAAKKSPESSCKAMFKHLQDSLKSQVEDVARELARHRMERGLGREVGAAERDGSK